MWLVPVMRRDDSAVRSARRSPFSVAPLWAAALSAVCVSADVSESAEGPQYASTKSRAVVQRMVDAHGGLERWRAATAIHFESSLAVNFGSGTWVPFAEEATVDPGSRRVYARLPNPDGTFGRIAFDGKGAWSAGELQGIARAPARFTAWRNFYLFNLPWMTQDSGVRLGDPEPSRLPIGDRECLTVRMTFDAGTGDTPKDSYRLFIDPLTYRLMAAEYVMTYTTMMRNGAKASPPSIFVWEETADVGGLIVPTRYTVYWSHDHSVAVKDGRIDHWAFDARFDESQLEMPPDGTPDASTP